MVGEADIESVNKELIAEIDSFLATTVNRELFSDDEIRDFLLDLRQLAAVSEPVEANE